MWSHFLVMLLGLWVMAAPDVLQYEGPERMNHHIVGPLVVSAAVIAMAETTRAVRWVNVVLGGWLMVAPVLLGFAPLHIGVRSSLVGAAILGLSLIEGRRQEQMGGGWPRLWRREPQHGGSATVPQTQRPHPPDKQDWRHTG
jgi:hypothetical protein